LPILGFEPKILGDEPNVIKPVVTRSF
jgi:hypothetical protein